MSKIKNQTDVRTIENVLLTFNIIEIIMLLQKINLTIRHIIFYVKKMYEMKALNGEAGFF